MIALPKRGSRALIVAAFAVTAASTTFAPILPPSISLIIHGVATGAPIDGLSRAGLVPGLLMGFGLMVVVHLHVRRRGCPPGPKATGRALRLAAAILDLSPDPYVFLPFLNTVPLPLGCFTAALVIVTVPPIVLPATTAMGFDPTPIGVMMVLNLMIGLVTLPVVPCLFAVAEVAEIMPFLAPLLVSLIVITLFLAVVLLVPRLFGFAP